MIGKAAFLAGGIAGSVALSQFPEFSQQYLQRLAGQVDALSEVVRDFDASAARNDMTREQALAEMTGTDFLADRQQDLRRTFTRYEKLTDNLVQLREASPLGRILMPQRLGDTETLSATWADFQPAVPVTIAGLIAAAIGFGFGGMLLAGLLQLILFPLRRLA